MSLQSRTTTHDIELHTHPLFAMSSFLRNLVSRARRVDDDDDAQSQIRGRQSQGRSRHHSQRQSSPGRSRPPRSQANTAHSQSQSRGNPSRGHQSSGHQSSRHHSQRSPSPGPSRRPSSQPGTGHSHAQSTNPPAQSGAASKRRSSSASSQESLVANLTKAVPRDKRDKRGQREHDRVLIWAYRNANQCSTSEAVRALLKQGRIEPPPSPSSGSPSRAQSPARHKTQAQKGQSPKKSQGWQVTVTPQGVVRTKSKSKGKTKTNAGPSKRRRSSGRGSPTANAPRSPPRRRQHGSPASSRVPSGFTASIPSSPVRSPRGRRSRRSSPVQSTLPSDITPGQSSAAYMSGGLGSPGTQSVTSQPSRPARHGKGKQPTTKSQAKGKPFHSHSFLVSVI